MATLDCETLEFAITCLSRIYRCDEHRLTNELVSFDWEAVDDQFAGAPSHAVADYLSRRCGAPTPPSKIMWFHGTRTLRSSTFEEGLLPLGRALNRIWDTIAQIVHETPHAANFALMYKLRAVDDDLYNLKTNKPLLGGPYAFLIRDVALRPGEAGSHDYLSIPEILEDICNGYQRRFGASILELVRGALAPCVVKFILEEPGERLANASVSVAAYYAQQSLTGGGLSGETALALDGHNTIVGADRIVSISFL